MKRLDGAVRWAGVVTFEVAAILALHRLGELPWLRVPRDDLAAWLATAPPEDAVATVLRLAALACAYWLLASTLLYTLARASRVPAAVRAVGWATLPSVRRVTDRAVAVALLGTTALGGAPVAVASAPVPAAVGDAEHLAPEPPRRAGGDDDGRAPEEAGDGPDAPSAVAPWPPALGPPPRIPPPAPGEDVAAERVTYTVVPGDNLWTITAAHLAQTSGLPRSALADADVHVHWVGVIEANRATLRSGDPDLIYPGERVTLAPLPGLAWTTSTPTTTEGCLED